MKKFTQVTKKHQEQQAKKAKADSTKATILDDVAKMCEANLHIGIYGPIDPVLKGYVKIDGMEDLAQVLAEYVKNLVENKTPAKK